MGSEVAQDLLSERTAGYPAFPRARQATGAAVDASTAGDESSTSGVAYPEPVAVKPGEFLEETLREAPPGWIEALRSVPKVHGLTQAERDRIDERNKTAIRPPPSGSGYSFSNHLAFGLVGTLGRILIRGLNQLHLYRMDVLYNVIEHRPKGLGLLTVSNHKSVADDPFMLAAIVPPRIMFRAGIMRWGLCSSDICYQNPWFAKFVMAGKALPIMRSAGVGHSFVTAAAEKLARGDWLHMYPEGRVVQHSVGYAKRGVGRMLAVAHERCGGSAGLPIVLPMYHEGIENVMPQDRETHELLSFIPRIGHRLFAIAGDPIDVRDIFERLMPACRRAGGTTRDPEECMKLYEELADRIALSIKILRAELRLKVRKEHGIFLGDPYEVS